MKTGKIMILALPVFLSWTACKTVTKSTTATPDKTTAAVKVSAPEPAVYREARKRENDLIHTRLEVNFDWKKKYLNGKATLTLAPYFYPVSSLELDAKGFNIKEVALLRGSEKKKLEFQYDSLKLKITLDKEYRKDQPYSVFIEYTAKPDELEVKGSAAISEAKGLYFINADGKDPDKPKQIWTQGETEASSCWFPTIDSPNERMTQEIYITVDTSFITLSNGLLEYSSLNVNGTRTDYWKQNLPAAPYLTMMAIGKFAVVKDKWRNIDVNYYVEPEYEKYAKMIFGNTPEMIEFFSKKLGVDYPWEKYSQIVVRDYVSGAMENTSAVIHGEFLQRNDREFLDATNEDVISHELFHHWFGDLVTCESWSNLPLNESFATYGEYLWNEYKYGKEQADYSFHNDLRSYLQEAENKKANLIRFGYKDKEDMFDAHSYQKGGRVLHMLRNYLGDDAFFASLRLYLTANRFSSAEIHHLRLAFEQVSGEDLNWFFNQWFLSSGHPELDIICRYDSAAQKQKVIIKQTQNFSKTPLFRLPITVDLYMNGKTERKKITVTKAEEEFSFDAPVKPDLVNVDAEKILLCTKKETKPTAEWVYQYYHAPLYLDRYEALMELRDKEKDSLAYRVVLDALSDKAWNIRSVAVRNMKSFISMDKEGIKKKLIELALKDVKSNVRSESVDALSRNYKDEDLVAVYQSAASDKSFAVAASAIEAMYKNNPGEGKKLAKLFEQEESNEILLTIAGIYAKSGEAEHFAFFESADKKIKGYGKYGFYPLFSKYLLKSNEETIVKGLKILENAARNGSAWIVRLTAVNAISDIGKQYGDTETKLKGKLDELRKQNKDAPPTQEMNTLEAELAKVQGRKDAVTTLLKEIKQAEKDSNLTKIYGISQKGN